MKKRKILIFLLWVVIGCTVFWYVNFPAYEKLAEERIDTYMEDQGVDEKKVIKKQSMKNLQGRWEIAVKFEDEKNLTYQYTYDRQLDRVLLFVYETPLIIGGRVIRSEGWTQFDKDGEIIEGD